MIEPEMAFCDLNGDMDLAEELVKYLIADIRKNCPDELELFAQIRRQGAAGAARFRGRAAVPADRLRGRGRAAAEERAEVRVSGRARREPAVGT